MHLNFSLAWFAIWNNDTTEDLAYERAQSPFSRVHRASLSAQAARVHRSALCSRKTGTSEVRTRKLRDWYIKNEILQKA